MIETTLPNRYCQYCGKKLNIIKSQYYSITTGKKKIYVCIM